jgi:hypothetical protein
LPQTQTESVGLLTVDIEEQKVVSRTPDFPSPDSVNPYVTQTPTQILEREFEAAGFTLTSTTAETFTVIQPPFFTEQSFVAACATFRYIKWKSMRWRVQGLCSPFVYGWYGLTCLPNNIPTRTGLLSTDYGFLSHCDSVIVDMCSAHETVINTPWLYNTEWLDLDRLAYLSVGPDVWQNVLNLNALKIMYTYQNMHSLSSTIPATYQGIIFCKLEGVEVAGPRQYRLIPAPSLAEKKIKEKEKKKVQYQSALLGAAAAAAGSYAYNRVGPTIEKQANKLFDSSLDSAASTVTDWISSFMTEDEPEPASPLVQESEAESTNVIPSVYGSMNISKASNVMGQGTATIAKGKARKHSILRELQKPSLVYGLVLTPTTTFESLTLPTLARNLQPITTDSDLLPMCSRLRFFSTMHRWWRGSVNYHFVLISSPLVTWKMKFTLVYGEYAAPVAPLIGDIIGDVVTIKGTTVHNITIPYLATNPWIPTQNPGAEILDPVNQLGEVFPTLFIQKLAPPITSGDIAPVLHILVFESAGHDFRFASPQEARPVSSSSVEYQMRVADLNKARAPAQGLAGYADRFTTDNVMTVEDLAKKWSVRPTQILRGPCPNATGLATDCYDLSILDAVSTLYYYWRGQVKFKMAIDPAVADVFPEAATLVCKMFPATFMSCPYTATPDAERFSDGCHVISGGLTQCLTVTMPFTSNAEYLSTLDDFVSTSDAARCLGSVGATNFQYQAFIYTDGSDTSFPLAWVAVAAGEDFSFAYPMPPPCRNFRWYDSISPDLRVPKPFNLENHSAGLERSTLVRPTASVTETSKLLRQDPPSGVTLHIR